MSKRGGKQPHELPYSKVIANKVIEMAPSNSVKDIFSYIQKYQNAPGSLTTFYKLYRADMDIARGNITTQIGDKVINSAINGDDDDPLTHKAREFYLDRKGGWNKQAAVEVREVGTEEEENENAVEALIHALKLDEEEE